MWYYIPIIILGILVVGQTEISISPFSFKIKAPYLAAGAVFLGLSIFCFYLAGYKQGYKDKRITKEELIEVIKDIKERGLLE